MTETGIQIFQAHGTDTNFGEKRLFLSKQVEGYEFEPVSVFGYELEPSYPSALREMVTRAPRKAVSWVQKTCRRRSLQLSAVESTVAAVQLVANHEENENDGCGAMTTYTAAPTKAKAFLGTPQFSTITPQQAMALYAKKHSNATVTNEHSRKDEYPFHVWRAGNRNMAFSNKGSAEVDDFSQNSATVGASQSFESGCSSSDGIEFSHVENKPLPSIC